MYGIHEMDEHARWMLALGGLMGAGPKASFGVGFF